MEEIHRVKLENRRTYFKCYAVHNDVFIDKILIHYIVLLPSNFTYVHIEKSLSGTTTEI